MLMRMRATCALWNTVHDSSTWRIYVRASFLIRRSIIFRRFPSLGTSVQFCATDAEGWIDSADPGRAPSGCLNVGYGTWDIPA